MKHSTEIIKTQTGVHEMQELFCLLLKITGTSRNKSQEFCLVGRLHWISKVDIKSRNRFYIWRNLLWSFLQTT